MVLLSRPRGRLYDVYIVGLPTTTTSRVPLALLYSLRRFVGRLIHGFDSLYTARLPAGLARYHRRYPPAARKGRWISWLYQLLRRGHGIATLMPLEPLAWALPRHPLYTLGSVEVFYRLPFTM